MGSRGRIAVILLVACASAAIVVTSATGTRVTAAQLDANPVAATLNDQVDLAVTVYNSNVALVRDVRQVSLANGVGVLHLADIAASVNPASVHFRSLTEPSRLAVLEQSYQFDLLDPQRLLRKYIGRDGFRRS